MDTAFTQEVARTLDLAQHFDLVPDYLSRVAQNHPDRADHEELARRLFEAGRVADTLDVMPRVAEASLTLRSLEAIALLRRDRRDEASAAIQEIRGLPAETAAPIAAWLEVCAAQDTRGDEMIRVARAAREAGARNAYLELILAETYQRAGQLNAAEEMYRSALSRRPSWPAPCIKLAELTLARGETASASRYALAALRRQPESLEAHVRVAQTMGSDPKRLDQDQRKKLMALIDKVQAARPGEPRTLAVRIDLLAWTGDPGAADRAARAALELDPPLSQEAFLALLESLRRHRLGSQEAVQDAYVERFGQTLDIALILAIQLGERGQTEAALASYDAAMPPDQPAAWRVNRAVLLERLGHPGAAAAWAGVADGLPDNARVQNKTLESRTAWRDRALIDRTVERLRALAGDDTDNWRIHRARWLMQDQDPARHAGRVVELLADIGGSAAALRLRAAARRLLGEDTRAEQLLQEAVLAAPQDVDAALDLATLKRELGAKPEAADLAQAATGRERLSPNQARRAANLLVALGEPARAALPLDRLRREGRAQTADLVALATLYEQSLQPGRALALVDELLENPTAQTVSLVVGLQASAGRVDEAQKTLGRLEPLGIPPARVAKLRAAFFTEYGSRAQADEALLALTRVDPADAEAWRTLAAYRLRTGRSAEAIDSARKALGHAPDDEGLLALVGNAQAVERLAEDPGAASFAVNILNTPAHRLVAAEAIQVLDQTTGLEQTARRADELEALAAAHPGFETLQVVAVTAQLAAGRYQAALERATDMTRRFPESARAARLTAEAWASIGRWREVLLAAESWARLGGPERPDAHTLMARAQRELDRANIAVSVLDPYQELIQTDPLSRPTMAREWSLAIAATGRTREARELLLPRLDAGATWRMTALDAAVLYVPSTRQAQEWLEAVAASVPDEAWDEKAALAQAWWSLGRRDSYRPFLERGQTLGRQLAQTPAATADLWYFLGTVGEAEGRLDEAEAAYRRAIEIDPQTIYPRNNLAMVLATGGGDLAEAERQARAILEQRPEEPNFHDTLAFVLMTAGRLGEAETAIRAAIDLDPSNPSWRVRLDEIQARAAGG